MILLESTQNLLDEEFFTWHDHTFSQIKGTKMLADYVNNTLQRNDLFLVSNSVNMN